MRIYRIVAKTSPLRGQYEAKLQGASETVSDTEAKAEAKTKSSTDGREQYLQKASHGRQSDSDRGIVQTPYCLELRRRTANPLRITIRRRISAFD